MDDRFNTIAGWALAGGIAALGLGIVSGEYFHAERPEKMGYVVEGVVEEGEGGGEAEKPIAFYMAAADPAKGADVFKKCAACHTIDKGGANGTGPNLHGVLGEPIGQGKGFAFSDSLKAVGGTWDFQKLSDWLHNPKKFASGTKMTFAGLSKPEDRANIIAFLNQNSDAPMAMPAVPADTAVADAGAAAGDANAAAPAEGGNSAAPAEGASATSAAPKNAGARVGGEAPPTGGATPPARVNAGAPTAAGTPQTAAQK